MQQKQEIILLLVLKIGLRPFLLSKFHKNQLLIVIVTQFTEF